MFFCEISGFGCFLGLIFAIWFIRRDNKNKKLMKICNKLLDGEQINLKEYRGICKNDMKKAFGNSIKIVKEEPNKFKSTKENLKSYKDMLIKKALKERKFNV